MKKKCPNSNVSRPWNVRCVLVLCQKMAKRASFFFFPFTRLVVFERGDRPMRARVADVSPSV